MFSGIILGLAAVVMQGSAYIFSKHFIIQSPETGARKLLIISHLTMGVVSIPLLLILLRNVDLSGAFIVPLLRSTLFYMLAQLLFFVGLCFTEPSRLAPLLGTKVVFVGLFGVLFFSQSVSALQSLALFLCLTGAILSSWSGSKVHYISIISILMASGCFALADLYVKDLLEQLRMFDSTFTRATVATLMTYVLCAIICLPFLFLFKNWSIRQFIPALPYSASWFAAGLFLFGSIALIGPIFAGVVQSSRALICVFLGIMVSKLGFSKIEQHIKSNVLILRVIAAILIMLSVILYMQK